MVFTSRCRIALWVVLMVVCLGLPSVQAQTIDCDAPAPTTPGTITTGRPYTIAFCLPSTVDVKNTDGTVSTFPTRVDGFTAVLDGASPVELGKLPLGAPSPVEKLSPVSYRTNSGVAKGNHTVVITPWNCPIDPATGVPMTTCTAAQKQNASPVSIPFVATEDTLPGAPPSIQKGRITR